MNEQKVTIVYHKTAKEAGDYEMPDADTEVMIYDDYIDDVVLGYLDERGDGPIWIEASSDWPLVSPRWWAKKPFPAGV